MHIALLSCLIGGIPFYRVHEFNFESGEIRCNVDYQSVTSMASRLPSQTYSDIIKRGQLKLHFLRQNPDVITNVKDLKYDEEERIEAEIKMKTDAKKRQEAETRLVKKKDSNGIVLGPNGTATLVASSFVVGVAVLASPDEANVTILVDSDGQSRMNETQQNNETNGENDFSSDDVTDVDVKSFMGRTSKGIQSEDLVGLSSEEVVHSGNDTQGIQPDYDYNDVWLGTISDILNEDEARRKE